MTRALLGLGILFGVAAGCQLPPEKLPVKPLPEDSAPLPYPDVVSRACAQASAAVEAFYLDKWDELESAAQALEQSARFLTKATDVPANRKDDLATHSAELVKTASLLRDAAKKKDVQQANEQLQHINLKVRELRPE